VSAYSFDPKGDFGTKERRQRGRFTCRHVVSTYAYQATSEQKEEEPQIHVDLGKRAENSYFNPRATFIPKEFKLGMPLRVLRV